MKNILILRVLLSVSFAICVITIVFGIPFTLMFSAFPQLMPPTLHLKVETLNGVGRYILPHLLLMLAETACFAYALYRMKELVKLFEKRIFFDARVSAHFKKAGQMILLSFMIGFINGSFYLTYENFIGFDIDIDLATFLLPATGLLLMALSDVFTSAKILKDEANLTI
ncbi:DUF2975 domain-containing protein [Flavobacterium sp. RNTU_13]|uniref:DUF2975 domain-containing protein n=1 Tax=Flavobacterium sp. RNTU_13 TaxID=3375145 RepID=UPI003987CBC8